MTTNTGSPVNPKQPADASERALRREQEAAPDEVPVKQHNPGDKGLNPDQKGPAQPSGSDAKGTA
jgi:hypothetical protein